jgi:glutamine synthetase
MTQPLLTTPNEYLSYQAGQSSREPLTHAKLQELLQHDIAVKVAGIDVDGILRGKIMTKSKFFSAIKSNGFGFCSVVFGWDMHDKTYFRELKISNSGNGFRDLLAVVDLDSFRRIPWEDGMPFFLVRFLDPDSGRGVCADPRGLVSKVVGRVEKAGLKAMAGGQYFIGRRLR